MGVITKDGYFVIVAATKNLYTKNYVSVQGKKVPKNDGDKATVILKNIGLEVNDCYWSEDYLIEKAKNIGFAVKNLSYPLALDNKNFFDECLFPPYYILTLIKC